MKKLPSFVFGIALGAILMFVSLNYHVIRANDGFHMVPKTSAGLKSIYVDIREFTVDDWRDQVDLMKDITESNNTALQEEAAKGALGNTVQEAWNDWTEAE